ncbi:MAG: phosphoglucosamine mutase [candidate division WOR-3 bacterium]
MANVLFTISGLRGIFGRDLTLNLVTDYVLKFTRFVRGKKIAVGRDSRPSGEILWHTVVAALQYAGCRVYDFAICPTPAIVMMVKKMNLDAGIQITASHNPIQYNGLKFISPEGRFFFNSEITKFKNLLVKDIEFDEYKIQRNYLITKNIGNQYISNIINAEYFKNIRVPKIKVAIDSCNGAAEDIAITLIKSIGAQPITINKKTFGFPRPPEPTKDNLTKLSRFVKKHRLDVGIAFDPDGDRFACVDEKGNILSEEMTILLALLFILSKRKGPVVVNNSTTMAVDDICRDFKVSVFRSKTGEANVVEKMQEVNALIGGEGNGGVILPSINNTRDGLVAATILLKLLAQQNKPLSEIRKIFPNYYMFKTSLVKYDENWKDKIVMYFHNNKSIKKIEEIDGIKFIGDGFWVLIRQSNTEPILRIIAESRDYNFTQKLIREARKICAG